MNNMNNWTRLNWTEQSRAEQNKSNRKIWKMKREKIINKIQYDNKQVHDFAIFSWFFYSISMSNEFQCSVITEWVNHFFKILKWTSYLIHIPKVSITLISWTGKSLAKHCDAETAFRTVNISNCCFRTFGIDIQFNSIQLALILILIGMGFSFENFIIFII